MDKTALRAALLRQLETDIARQTEAAHDSRDEATSGENKAEGKYDMRAQEAAYLAEGQARMVAEMGESLALYAVLTLPAFTEGQPIALGAVITLTTGDRTLTCLLGPRAGGLEVDVGGLTVLVITPASPLGRQLPGLRTGDTVSLPGRGGSSIRHVITAVE